MFVSPKEGYHHLHSVCVCVVLFLCACFFLGGLWGVGDDDIG